MLDLDSDLFEGLDNPAELSASRSQSKKSAAPPETSSDGSTLPEVRQPSDLPEAVSLPATSTSDGGAHDEIAKLEAEERRIDAELAEATRIQTLKQEKLAVQAQLRNARERSDSVS